MFGVAVLGLVSSVISWEERSQNVLFFVSNGTLNLNSLNSVNYRASSENRIEIIHATFVDCG